MVRDLVRANLLAMERGLKQTTRFSTLGNGEGLSVYRIAELISGKAGFPGSSPF